MAVPHPTGLVSAVLLGCGGEPKSRAPSDAGGDAGDVVPAAPERAALDRNSLVAVVAAATATVTATDLFVRDTRTVALASAGGQGLSVASASVTLRRATFFGNRATAIGLFPEGSLVAEDLAVLDTLPEGQLEYLGFGLSVEGGAAAELTRAVFLRNRTVGLSVGERGATLVAEDLAVRDTLAQEVDLDYGYGLRVVAGGSVDLTRSAFEGNRRAGIVVDGTGTTARLRELSVGPTLERACVPDCGMDEAGAGGGIGLVVSGGASAEVTAFKIAEGALCGVQVASGGDLDLHEGDVSRNPIGANVQIPGYDLARLQDRVLYHDNERDVDGATLSVPQPAGAP